MLALAAATVLVAGLSWAVAEAATPPSEFPWKARERRENVLWGAIPLSVLGLTGGVIGVEMKRRRRTYAAAAGISLVPGSLAALFLLPTYWGFLFPYALLGGAIPSLLGATIAYVVAAPPSRVKRPGPAHFGK